MIKLNNKVYIEHYTHIYIIHTYIYYTHIYIIHTYIILNLTDLT